MESYDQLDVDRKRGDEPLHDSGRPLDATLLAFWQWSASDLVNNAMRGRLAEFLVAHALGAADGVRVEWDAYDVRTPGGLKIEVKSAAYLQTWPQSRLSAIGFDIRPTLGWEAATNSYSTVPTRQADLYVFALLTHREKATVDPLDVSQWEFYVLPTAILDRELPLQKRASLATLLRLGATATPYGGLAATIEHWFSREEPR